MERDRRAPRLRSRERPPVCSILPAAARITGIRRGAADGFGGEFRGTARVGRNRKQSTKTDLGG